jgi:hypothetical protein
MTRARTMLLQSLVGLVVLRFYLHPADRLFGLSHVGQSVGRTTTMAEYDTTISVNLEQGEREELLESSVDNGTPIDNDTPTAYKPQEDMIAESTMDSNTAKRTAAPLSSVKLDINHQSTTNGVTTLDKNRTRSIAFVHVGKAGGNTVRWALPRLECSRLRNSKWREQRRCFRDTYRPESPLASQVNSELHMGGGPRGKNLRDNYDTFLFALRNPVTRAISAYEYLHYNHKRSVFAQKKHPLKDVFYIECFPNIQDLLETLEEIDMATANTSSTLDQWDTQRTRHDNAQHPQHCQQMAITVLQGRHPKVKHINVHLIDNYQFYYQHTIEENPTKEVLVIRTEYLWEDIKELDVAMGGPGVFENEGDIANQNRKSHPDVYNTPTSEDDGRKRHQLHNLCCILVEEMKIYQEILNRASNFDYHRKLETMQGVWASCGIDSLQIQKFQDQEADVGEIPDRGTSQPPPIIHFSWSKWLEASCPELPFVNESEVM